MSQRGLIGRACQAKGMGCLKIANFNTELQIFVFLIFHTKGTEYGKPRHSDNAAGVRRVQVKKEIPVLAPPGLYICS